MYDLIYNQRIPKNGTSNGKHYQILVNVFFVNLCLYCNIASNEDREILLEWGFMSNPSEFEQIANPQEQQKMAKSIADGITQWLVTSAKN